jgi:hypothetical protein
MALGRARPSSDNPLMIIRKVPLVALATLAATVLACAFGGTATAPAPRATSTPEPGFVSAREGGEVEGPLGTRLVAEPGALSADTRVTIDVAGSGVPFPDASPLDPASPEFEVDLGGAEVSGLMTMTVPLTGSIGRLGALAEGQPVYVAQTYTADGVPWMLGAEAEDNEVTFQVVSSGNYQLYEMDQVLVPLTHVPLVVPSYAQHTPAWCSPTAMTDLVQFHQGAWPAGGDGSVWGQSSNWYLAGQAGQPFDTGYFFHWLVEAGGFSGVPDNVKQSFANNDLEVMIWYITGANNPQYDSVLWNAFRNYVESWVWGATMERRPVAWGSSIAGHSRVITGSDGTVFYYNETGNGAINLTREWADYQTAALEGDEIVDTVVIYSDPRPLEQRRGVLRLNPFKPNDPGSIRLLRASDDALMASWRWDGTGGRTLGYYYDDPLGMHAADPQLDVAFHFDAPEDYLAYSFQVANIGTADYAFEVRVDLYPDGSAPGGQIGVHGSPAALAPKGTWSDGDTTVVGGLGPGLYMLRFRLFQGAVLQDVKYVKFRVASPPFLIPPELIPIEPFIPLGDPELSTHELYYRGAGCGPKEVTFRIHSGHPEAESVVLFYRLKDGAGGRTTAFSEGVAMNPAEDGWYAFDLAAESVPDFAMFDEAVLQYQFVLTDAAGQILGRSPVYSDVAFGACGR